MAGIPLGWNALCCFAARGDMEAVQCLVEATVSSRADIREMTVVRKRILPDAKGLFGDTALHLASIHGHVAIVEYLLEERADPSMQNDLGQTPLFTASLHGQERCLEALITGGVDMKRLSVDGLTAYDVAGSEECRFLLRSLLSDADDEESLRRAEATKARLKITMIKWAKACMVDAYKTWKDFALIPENKLDRLISEFDGLGLQREYPSANHIVDHSRAVHLYTGAQTVIYSGKKGLGAQGGSGHPLLLGIDGVVSPPPAPPPVNAGRIRPPDVAQMQGAGRKAATWQAGVIERPDLLCKRDFDKTPSTQAQLMELETDKWGMRSIATARVWAEMVTKLFQTAIDITTRYHFIMDEPRSGSSYTNIQVLQHAVRRFSERMVCPHRTMLHGLRPRAFRSANVLSSQALVVSTDFPANFPGAPSDRRLFASRYLHLWAWLIAHNNPPGYLPISDLQAVVRRASEPLHLLEDPHVQYLLVPAFRPQEEIMGPFTRMHVQSMNLPLPPHHAPSAGPEFYAKALAKVPGEPAAEVVLGERAPTVPGARAGGAVSRAYNGSMLLDDVDGDYLEDFIF